MKFFSSGFNNKSRTENVVRNVNIALICQAMNTVLGFVSRSFFIKLLGETYLGINGIFSNVLTILNFAELGIGTAIVYNLYKPLKEHDEEEVGKLVYFYKKAYLCIACVILTAGLALLPFLRWLISEQPDIKESISVLYVIYLINTVISYFNAHKKSLLGADQKQHINNIYRQVAHTTQIVLQIILLIATHNYILYLFAQIACNILENILISRETDRIYPFLKNYKHSHIERELYKSIKKDVGALTIYKLNSAVIHGTDNILITALADKGVQAVGLYSNYTLISETLNTILGIIQGALTPSIGNLNADTDEKKKEKIFYIALYVCAWVYGLACTGILILSKRFVISWIGERYLLDVNVVFAIALQLYIRSVHYPAYTYRVTCGLFVQSKYVPIFTSLLNIGLSIWMGKYWGLFGILFATSIARVCTVGISDPYLVYKYVFNKKVATYYFYYCKYLVLVGISCIAGRFCCNLVYWDGWTGFVLAGIVYSVIYSVIFCGFTIRSSEFRYVKDKIESYIKRV